MHSPLWDGSSQVFGGKWPLTLSLEMPSSAELKGLLSIFHPLMHFALSLDGPRVPGLVSGGDGMGQVPRHTYRGDPLPGPLPARGFVGAPWKTQPPPRKTEVSRNPGVTVAAVPAPQVTRAVSILTSVQSQKCAHSPGGRMGAQSPS